MKRLTRLFRLVRLSLLVSGLLSFASSGLYLAGYVALGSCCLSLATTLYIMHDE